MEIIARQKTLNHLVPFWNHKSQPKKKRIMKVWTSASLDAIQGYWVQTLGSNIIENSTQILFWSSKD